MEISLYTILFRTNWSRKKQHRNLNRDRYTRVPYGFTSTMKRWYTLGTRLKRLVCKTVLEPPFHFLIFSSLRVVLAILDARLSSRTIDLDKLLADFLSLSLSLYISLLSILILFEQTFFIVIGTINIKLSRK